MSDPQLSAFTPVNMIERQLVAAANGDHEQQKAFEKFILDETLYVATPETPAEDRVIVTEADTTLNFLTVALTDGRQATAVFTSIQRVAETFGNVGYAGFQGRALFEIVRASPAVLNPGQTYGVVWEPESLAAMLGLPSQRVVEKDTQVMVGYPADPPTELVARLRAAFAKLPDVDAAWLALAAWPEAQTQSWYLDVRTKAADHEHIRLALPAAIDNVDMKDRPLDMIINPAAGSEGVGIVIVEPSRAQPAPKKGLLGRLFG